jgi:hypothetical protein
VVISTGTVKMYNPPYPTRKFTNHIRRAHLQIYSQYFNLSRDERSKYLKNDLPDNRVGTILQHIDVNNFGVKIEAHFVDLLIDKLIVFDDMSRERAKVMFGNLIYGDIIEDENEEDIINGEYDEEAEDYDEEEEDIIGSSDNGPAASVDIISVPHYFISLHTNKFKTIQTMVAKGITFRQIIESLAILRGTFGCGWMTGINSDLVQRYVRIICAINLQALSGLMKQAYPSKS